MALRIRRRTNTLSGVVPEQGLERFLWVLFVPVVAAWMALPLLAAFRTSGEFAIPEAAHSGPWLIVRALAALATVALLTLTIRCWRRMGRQWKMAVTPGLRQVLITDGPFARVRHPIYGYQILLMLASLVVVPTRPMLLAAGVHVVLMTLKARNEERHLLGHARRGLCAIYRAYRPLLPATCALTVGESGVARGRRCDAGPARVAASVGASGAGPRRSRSGARAPSGDAGLLARLGRRRRRYVSRYRRRASSRCRAAWRSSRWSRSPAFLEAMGYPAERLEQPGSATRS